MMARSMSSTAEDANQTQIPRILWQPVSCLIARRWHTWNQRSTWSGRSRRSVRRLGDRHRGWTRCMASASGSRGISSSAATSCSPCSPRSCGPGSMASRSSTTTCSETFTVLENTNSSPSCRRASPVTESTPSCRGTVVEVAARPPCCGHPLRAKRQACRRCRWCVKVSSARLARRVEVSGSIGCRSP